MSICNKDHVKTWQLMCSSSIGAMITSTAVTPLDIIKIRLQVQNKPIYGPCFLYCNGLMDTLCLNINGECKSSNVWFKRTGDFKNSFDALIKIVRHEGVLTLWSGLSPTLVMAIPQVVIYYTLNENFKRKIGYTKYQQEKFSNQTSHIHLSNFSRVDIYPAICGAMARIVAQSVIAPLELIRTKMQSKKISLSEMKSVVRQSVNENGASIMWRGMGPTMWRDVPYTMCLWFIYEFMKKQYISVQSTQGIQSDHFPSWFIFMSSSIGAFFAGIISHPFDVAKTHRQVELGEAILHNKPLTPTLAYLKELYSKLGIKSLFSGIGPRIIRVCTATSLMVSLFEAINFQFSKHNQRHRKMSNLDSSDS